MAQLILWNCLNVDHAPIRPAGPHQLSHWLKCHGYTVKVIDFCNLLNTRDLVDITLKNIDNDTIAIGVSSTFWSVHSNLAPLKPGTFLEPDWVIDARIELQEKMKSNIDWILGGGGSIEKNFKFDWKFFHGHAEDSLLKYMDESTVRVSNRKPFDIANLENCFYDDLYLHSDEVLPIELSRGCQFKCTFCRYPLLGKRKNTYIRSYDLIEKEFIENYEKYGTTKYFFLDDTVNESTEKVEALANISQRLPFKLQWFGYNRLDLMGVQRHTIELLEASGLKSSFFGIESFHKKASKLVGKGWNGAHAKDFLLELQERWNNKMNFHLGFIVGLTGENNQDIDDTQKWCIDNNMPSWKFLGLHINKNNDQVYKSEFDLNHEMYGYKFLSDSDLYWSNKDWDAKTARIKAVELTNESQQYIKPAVWLLGEISTLGYDTTTLMNTYKNNLDWNELKYKTKEFVLNYASHQLK